MEIDEGILNDGLQKCDGYCRISMWNEAWNALEDLPDELRMFPVVLVQRLRILVGSEEWAKTRILGESVVDLLPPTAAIHYYLACAYSETGEVKLAKEEVSKCMELDPEYGLLFTDSPHMKAYWNSL